MSTVRVRIAVAVWPDGEWNSCGWSGGSDEKKIGLAIEPGPDGELVSWVEADVPIPASVVIDGDVAPVEAEAALMEVDHG